MRQPNQQINVTSFLPTQRVSPLNSYKVEKPAKNISIFQAAGFFPWEMPKNLYTENIYNFFFGQKADFGQNITNCHVYYLNGQPVNKTDFFMPIYYKQSKKIIFKKEKTTCRCGISKFSAF